MATYMTELEEKRAELAVEESRLAEWDAEGFTAGVVLVKKGILALKKIIREIESY
ncbi:hypothetical protein SNQ26_003741 [Cronobacter malonaticus]|uniref:hypothetical protein n=1 Tax=Cronobacter malonaticus TaxID=413503 RepID=UPI0024AF68A3|nr:hypothetical protein [Cronobacter malonaticus]ELY5941218.1 hypothetical protein [Cronobacter malonaticus]ELY6201959.1 hypothetical protein [Cronobacter malonaticus]ELY6230513.1 hypothetical protein [Cronobacter malonaticus]ELY6256623.1 hypothetical protein [Cronobacter malonaticus]MDI7595055.1 hypothetical protein [Cronobacter malonaticus]